MDYEYTGDQRVTRGGEVIPSSKLHLLDADYLAILVGKKIIKRKKSKKNEQNGSKEATSD